MRRKQNDQRIGTMIVLIGIGLVAGFIGTVWGYVDDSPHLTLGVLLASVGWGVLTGICLSAFFICVFLCCEAMESSAANKKRRPRSPDRRFALQSDNAGGGSPSLEGHFDTRSNEGGSTESTSHETSGQFGSTGSSMSESTIFNPATGLEMNGGIGGFDSAGNMFGHGFGE